MEDQDSDVSDFSDFEDARDPDLLEHVKIESVTSKAKEVMSKLKVDVVGERRLKDSLSTLKIKSKRIAEEALKSNLDEKSKEKDINLFEIEPNHWVSDCPCCVEE